MMPEPPEPSQLFWDEILDFVALLLTVLSVGEGRERFSFGCIATSTATTCRITTRTGGGVPGSSRLQDRSDPGPPPMGLGRPSRGAGRLLKSGRRGHAKMAGAI
jgi:hypothetical protein